MSKRVLLHRLFPTDPIGARLPALGLLLCVPLAASGLGPVPGAILRWLGLMLAPGMALYLASERKAPRLSRLALSALVLSPVVTTVLAIAGLTLRVPVMTISGAISALAIAAAAVAFATQRTKIARPDRRSSVWLGVLLLLVVGLTAFLPMTHHWWRVRSDAWFHAAVVAQIADYGIPPQDPYFAGMPLQYMWFYHVLVFVLARGLVLDPFRVMALLNIQALLALGVGAWMLAGVFRKDLAPRLGAASMMLLGFNGAFWVFLPVKLVRALVGDVRGWNEIRRTYSLIPLNYDHACQFMNIYYNQEFFLDKFMVATAFGLALAFMTAGWYGASEYLRTRRPAPLVLLAGAMVGMLGFHSLVGFVMLVGIFGGVIFAWCFRGREVFPTRRALVLLAVCLASFVVMVPYLYEVMHIKEKAQVFPIGVSLRKTLGIFISCAFALALAVARRPLVRERAAPTRFFLFGFISVTAFCLLIMLPGPNTYDKLGYLVFLPLSIPGGIALAEWWTERTGSARRVVVAVAVAFMLPVNAIALVACFATPNESLFTAPEARMTEWLRDHTTRNSLIIDDDDRVVFLVTVPRRYYWGTTAYAQQWGYPKLEMSRRLHVRRALYAPGALDGTTLDALASVTDPLYVIIRPQHWDAHAAVITNVDLFDAVYRDEKYCIVRVNTQVCRALAPGRGGRLSAEELIRESGL